MGRYQPHYCTPAPTHRSIARIIGRICLVIVTTLLLLVMALYGVMYILAKGPSPTARNLFVCSVQETSAIGFLANLFFSEEEIQQIMASQNDTTFDDTDSSLIVIPPSTPADPDDPNKPVADEWGLVDEDGDGIIIDTVRGGLPRLYDGGTGPGPGGHGQQGGGFWDPWLYRCGNGTVLRWRCGYQRRWLS